MKTWILAAAAGTLALFAQPVIAQEADDDLASFAAMAEMFQTDPLTPEEEARLPLSREVVAAIMPEGAMAEAMGTTFDSMLEPLLAVASEPTATSLAKSLGSAPSRDMSDEEIAEAALLLDPVRDERNRRMAEIMPDMIGLMIAPMEPYVREAMVEIHAVNFTAAQLTEILGFFGTETGAAYARKSLQMQQDPRMISAMMKAMPLMMESLGQVEAMMEERMADLPAERGYDDLSTEQRERLSALTGLDQGDLEKGLAEVAAARDQAKADDPS